MIALVDAAVNTLMAYVLRTLQQVSKADMMYEHGVWVHSSRVMQHAYTLQ